MQIDFGFNDMIYPIEKLIEYPVILDFPKPHLKVYPVESVVSEKFEAMIKLGLLNSRMKDFYDIWLMMHQFSFEGSTLTEALRKTCTHRKIEIPKGKKLFNKEIYNEKSDRQILWKAFLNKGDIKHTPEKLSSVAKEIEKILSEPLDAVNKSKKFYAEWKASGPWKYKG